MAFTKPLSEVVFSDIELLQKNKVHESDILDYKAGLIDDDQLIRHVTSFANTRGGVVLFGVEETGKGGYPTDIPGVDSEEINKERMEQILLGNVSPRLHVRIREIPHTAAGKSVLIVQIPDSSLKPHMNLRLKKYHKRYEFEAVEMDEREVSDAYRRRLTGHQQVDEYLKRLLSKSDPRCKILGQIVVLPDVIDGRLIDTSDRQALAWLDPNKINPQPAGFVSAPNFGYLPSFPEPSPHGVICQDHTTHFRPYLELHRNGCVDYGDELAFAQDEGRPGFWYFSYVLFCLKLLHTLQFASMVYSRYDYFGDVRIVVSIKPSDKLVFPTQLHLNEEVCKSNSVTVEREFPSTMLESDYSYIASGIMHDIFNHFGFWRCELFDDKGNYIRSKFV